MFRKKKGPGSGEILKIQNRKHPEKRRKKKRKKVAGKILNLQIRKQPEKDCVRNTERKIIK